MCVNFNSANLLAEGLDIAIVKDYAFVINSAELLVKTVRPYLSCALGEGEGGDEAED